MQRLDVEQQQQLNFNPLRSDIFIQNKTLDLVLNN